jgi:hypothetical protein
VEGSRLASVGATAAGGGLFRQATCPLRKGFCLDGFMGVEFRGLGSLWLVDSEILGVGGGSHFI